VATRFQEYNKEYNYGWVGKGKISTKATEKQRIMGGDACKP